MRKQFGDRLKELRKEKGMTQEELSKIFNTGKASISHYESNRRLPDPNTIEKYAEYFNVTVDYLLGRTDTKNNKPIDLFPSFKFNENSSTLKILNEINKEHMVRLPIVGTVKAGLGGVAFEDYLGYEYAYGININEAIYFYLKVKGDSMEPRINEGDLALVRKQDDVENGELAVVVVNGYEGVIKKVVKKENCIELHSFNMYYPPRVFIGSELELLKIVGKVIKTETVW